MLLDICFALLGFGIFGRVEIKDATGTLKNALNSPISYSMGIGLILICIIDLLFIIFHAPKIYAEEIGFSCFVFCLGSGIRLKSRMKNTEVVENESIYLGIDKYYQFDILFIVIAAIGLLASSSTNKSNNVQTQQPTYQVQSFKNTQQSSVIQIFNEHASNNEREPNGDEGLEFLNALNSCYGRHDQCFADTVIEFNKKFGNTALGNTLLASPMITLGQYKDASELLDKAIAINPQISNNELFIMIKNDLRSKMQQ